MHHHRFRDQMDTPELPLSSQPVHMPGAFVVCPLPLQQALSLEQRLYQIAIYQLAFEQARAAARPSWVERDVLAAWN